MDQHDVAVQQRLHEAIEQAVFEREDLAGHILSGWIVVFETAALDDDRCTSGHLYGPREMTTWRALGLLEWARRFSLRPDEGD